MDQELRDLVEQMKELMPLLRNLSKRPGETDGATSRSDRSTDRLIAALAQLSVKLDTTKRTRTAEEEAIKTFAKSVDKTAEAMEKESKARNEAAEAEKQRLKDQDELARRSKLSQEERDKEDRERAAKRDRDEQERIEKKARQEMAQASRETREKIYELTKGQAASTQMFEAFTASGTATDLLKTKFFDLAGNSMGAQVGLRVVAAGAEGAAKSLKLFATGLLDGQRGAQLSAKAVTEFATPLLKTADILGGILSIASFFVPGGPLIKFGMRAGAALLGLGSAAGSAALKLNELGAKQLDTLVKTFNDASQAGVSLTGGLEGTLDLMHTLNMTTAEAAQFNELLAKSNKQLALMGGTAGVGARRFAEVSGALIKSNLGETFEIMGITQQEQREAALLYMSIQARTGQMQLKNTDQLIEQSGKFVEELDRAAQLTGATRKEQQEAREAAMAEVRFRSALIDARQRGDKAELARLETAQRTAAILKSMGDEKGFLGTLQAAAGGGALTTPEAIAAEQSYKISEILAKPNATDEEILAILAKNADINLKNLAGTNKFVGGIDALQTNIIGMDNTILRSNAIAEEAKNAGFTGPNAITQYLRDQEEKRKKPGGDLSLMVGAGRAQQSAAMTMEKGISTFNIAADINKLASENFDKAVRKFGDAVGFKVAGGTPTSGGQPLVAGAPVVSPQEAKTALENQTKKVKNLEEQALAAEDRAKALEKDAKASRTEKEAARKKADELAAQLAQETRLQRQAQVAEQAARREVRRKEPGLAGAVDTKLMDALSSGGITDKRAQANILAQVHAESGGVAKSESLKYSPERLLAKFPKKFKDLQDAQAVVAGGEEAIGERVYGGRMGNMQPGEGFKYRGRGLIQLTGKDNYKKYGDMLGIDLVSNPELANDPDIARKIAVAYFAEKQKGGVNLTQSSQVSRAVGHVDIGGAESARRAAMADTIATMMPQAAQGGILSGPMSGYPAMLHGKEAVIPLQEGSVPVSMPALDELVSSNRAVDAQVQVLRNEMGSMMRELTTAMQSLRETGAQDRMIQLLESISRSQQTTATASTKMAQLAAN